MKKLTQDDEVGFYKVTYMGQEHNVVGLDISDVLSGYDDTIEVTKIEFVGFCFLSPGILK